jgi:hypothetical protein
VSLSPDTKSGRPVIFSNGGPPQRGNLRLGYRFSIRIPGKKLLQKQGFFSFPWTSYYPACAKVFISDKNSCNSGRSR